MWLWCIDEIKQEPLANIAGKPRMHNTNPEDQHWLIINVYL